MMDKYGHEWPDAYNRGNHTTSENLLRADAYVQDILSLEEHHRVITPFEAAEARRRKGAEPEPRPRPRKRVYHFSDRTNRPDPTPPPS